MGMNAHRIVGLVLAALAVLLPCSGCAGLRGGAGADAAGVRASGDPPEAADGSVEARKDGAAVAVTGASAGSRSVAHATQPRSTAPAFSGLPVPVAPRAMGNGTARLRWTRPAKLDYGKDAAADPVVGYRIYAGPRPDALQLEAQLSDPRATGYVMRRLPKGRYWFTVSTYTRLGVESERPQPVAKLVR